MSEIILGGLALQGWITIIIIIGMAPNLIVSGFYTDHISEFGAEAEAMNIFTPALPGIFCLLVGVVSIIIMQKLLPSRVSPEDEAANFSSNTTELKVPANSHLVGQTLEESNLIADINGEIVRRNSTGKCDLLRIGIPMNFIILLANIFICCILFPL